jgi:hypothetical protein
MFTVINTAAMGSTGVVMCCILHSPEHQLVHLQQAAVLERGALSVVNEIVNLIFSLFGVLRLQITALLCS